MGVPELWKVLQPAAQTESLHQIAVSQGFERNDGGRRGFRIGIDASIWLFHTKVFNGKSSRSSLGKNPELRMLFFRCKNFLELPLLPLFVFDGPRRPDWKRGKRVLLHNESRLVKGALDIIRAFGYQYIHAPGEAEAELAHLNRIGLIDAILTDDVDALLFGAATIIRNPSSSKAQNKEGKESKHHVNFYKAANLRTHNDVQLSQGGLVLIGLLRGGDYDPVGVPGIGVTIAHGLARCKFGDDLVNAVRTLQGDALDAFLTQWRMNIIHELRTNSRGKMSAKQPTAAKNVPMDFPDLQVVHAYLNPVISSVYKDIDWRTEPDVSLLAQVCAEYFEWGSVVDILRRFRSLLWPGFVCRILRRSVLLADDAAAAANSKCAVGGTPIKSKANFAQGMPSKMITQYFSQVDINSPIHRRFEDPGAGPLIVRICKERRHASTDGLLEFKLEIAPLQLAKLAEHALLHTRKSTKLNIRFEDMAEDKADKDKKNSHDMVWMPACMVELAAPRLLRNSAEGMDSPRVASAPPQKHTASHSYVTDGPAERTSADEHSDSMRKVPRKSKLQTSPRARRRVERLSLGQRANPGIDLQPPQRPTAQPVSAEGKSAADVIVLSSSEDELSSWGAPKKTIVNEKSKRSADIIILSSSEDEPSKKTTVIRSSLDVINLS